MGNCSTKTKFKSIDLKKHNDHLSIAPLKAKPSILASELPFPKDGLTIETIDYFIQQCGKDKLEGLTTAQVCSSFIKQLTSSYQLSYCQMLKSTGADSKHNVTVGKATVFIIHSWKYLFLDVIDAIKSHLSANNNKQINHKSLFWMDIFCINQNFHIEMDNGYIDQIFKSSIVTFNSCFCILLDWNNAYNSNQSTILFERTWCLYELYMMIISKIKVEIIFPKNKILTSSTVSLFLKILHDDDNKLKELLDSIDILQSQSTKQNDKISILEFISSTFHYNVDEFNKIIKDFILLYLINETKQEINQYFEIEATTTHQNQSTYFDNSLDCNSNSTSTYYKNDKNNNNNNSNNNIDSSDIDNNNYRNSTKQHNLSNNNVMQSIYSFRKLSISSSRKLSKSSISSSSRISSRNSVLKALNRISADLNFDMNVINNPIIQRNSSPCIVESMLLKHNSLSLSSHASINSITDNFHVNHNNNNNNNEQNIEKNLSKSYGKPPLSPILHSALTGALTYENIHPENPLVSSKINLLDATYDIPLIYDTHEYVHEHGRELEKRLISSTPSDENGLFANENYNNQAREIQLILLQHLLGRLYHMIGDFKEAEPLLYECVERGEVLLGENHKHTLNYIFYLALLYYDQNLPTMACSLFEGLLNILTSNNDNNNNVSSHPSLTPSPTIHEELEDELSSFDGHHLNNHDD
eukprot:gene10799-14497_t